MEYLSSPGSGQTAGKKQNLIETILALISKIPFEQSYLTTLHHLVDCIYYALSGDALDAYRTPFIHHGLLSLLKRLLSFKQIEVAFIHSIFKVLYQYSKFAEKYISFLMKEDLIALYYHHFLVHCGNLDILDSASSVLKKLLYGLHQDTIYKTEILEFDWVNPLLAYPISCTDPIIPAKVFCNVVKCLDSLGVYVNYVFDHLKNLPFLRVMVMRALNHSRTYPCPKTAKAARTFFKSFQLSDKIRRASHMDDFAKLATYSTPASLNYLFNSPSPFPPSTPTSSHLTPLPPPNQTRPSSQSNYSAPSNHPFPSTPGPNPAADPYDPHHPSYYAPPSFPVSNTANNYAKPFLKLNPNQYPSFNNSPQPYNSSNNFKGNHRSNSTVSYQPAPYPPSNNPPFYHSNSNLPSHYPNNTTGNTNQTIHPLNKSNSLPAISKAFQPSKNTIQNNIKSNPSPSSDGKSSKVNSKANIKSNKSSSQPNTPAKQYNLNLSNNNYKKVKEEIPNKKIKEETSKKTKEKTAEATRNSKKRKTYNISLSPTPPPKLTTYHHSIKYDQKSRAPRNV